MNTPRGIIFSETPWRSPQIGCATTSISHDDEPPRDLRSAIAELTEELETTSPEAQERADLLRRLGELHRERADELGDCHRPWIAAIPVVMPPLRSTKDGA